MSMKVYALFTTRRMIFQSVDREAALEEWDNLPAKERKKAVLACRPLPLDHGYWRRIHPERIRMRSAA